MVVGRLKVIKDLMLSKLDLIQSKIEQLEQVLSSSASSDNGIALLKSSVFLVEAMQRQEKLNQDFQMKILHQVNLIHRQGMVQRELQSDTVSRIREMQEQINAMQDKIDLIEKKLEQVHDVSKI